MSNDAHIFIEDFQSFKETVPLILRESGLVEKIKDKKQILLKPNLTTNRKPPCTTPVELVEEIVKFIQASSRAEIIVAEGSGGCDTRQAFKDLGYQDLADKYNFKLVDLNKTERIAKENPKALALKKVKLPKIIFESFFINLPVLKEHNEAVVTSAMKNLFGIYLNQSALSRFGWWNKSELHVFGVHQSIHDLNLYVKSDFVLVDASVGQKGSEITGFPCQPPIGKLIAGFDAKEIDKVCAQLLGHKIEEVRYLTLG